MSQDWFADLYDDFRMQTGFGAVPPEQTSQEAGFLWDVLSLVPGSRVLDLFCGAGRHSLELARRGCLTTGIELNRRYAEMARRAATESSRFVVGDVRFVDFGSGFDAAMIMFNSFGYFTDAEDKRILEKTRDALRPGGRFVIEILNRDWVLANFCAREEKVTDGVRIIETRQFDVLTSRNHFRIERHSAAGVTTREGLWRLYSPHEMKNLLEAAGFQFLAAYSNLKKEAVTMDTRLMRLVFSRV